MLISAASGSHSHTAKAGTAIMAYRSSDLLWTQVIQMILLLLQFQMWFFF